MQNQETDITKNIKVIEFLKSELLTTVASLYQGLLKGSRVGQEVIQDALANLVMVTYLLGKRLGVSYSLIDYRILEKIRIGLLEEHVTEKWYGDLTDLGEYLKKKKG